MFHWLIYKIELALKSFYTAFRRFKSKPVHQHAAIDIKLSTVTDCVCELQYIAKRLHSKPFQYKHW